MEAEASAPAALPAEASAAADPAPTSAAAPAPPPPPPPVVGSLVWCKVQGYPWWPGKLLSRPSATVAKVRFFETGAEVKVPAAPSSLVGFEHKLALCEDDAIKRNCKKPALRKALTAAVQQAREPGAAELAAAEAAAEAVAAERVAELAASWRREGHARIGKRVARHFGKALAYGTITRWVSAQAPAPGVAITSSSQPCLTAHEPGWPTLPSSPPRRTCLPSSHPCSPAPTAPAFLTCPPHSPASSTRPWACHPSQPNVLQSTLGFASLFLSWCAS
jgi:hypothetical protein